MGKMPTTGNLKNKNNYMKSIKYQLGIISLATSFMTAFAQDNSIVIKTSDAKDTISRYIYGHFAEHLGKCIYEGIWVGENSTIPNTRGIRNDVVLALKEIKTPVIRWPGGCFAETYHWKDGIGPKENRPPMLNMFWGGVSEDNSFGTHEFLDLCDQLGAEPYLAMNVASGSVQNAYDWIEYVNSSKDSPMVRLRKQNGREEPWKVKFWGIGNENWGCGGNMEASYYTDLFKQYSTYCWVDYKVASGGLGHDMNWTETVMKKTRDYQQLIQGYSYHHYTVCHTWEKKGSADMFDESEWFLTISKNMEMEQNLMEHMAIMDKYDPQKKIGLIADEWGNWHDPEPGSNPGFLVQKNTLRDALTASVYLNVFNNHCDRVKMANIAQTVNVLQAMLITQGEKMIKTPSFYVFKMYTVHHDALMLPLAVTAENYTSGEKSIPALSASASKNSAGEINITVSNVNPLKAVSTIISIDTRNKFEVLKAEIITAKQMNAMNDFDKPEQVTIQEFTDFDKKGDELIANLPAKSVVNFTLKTK
jgi:alpha-L-arabinofuranosidase